MGYARYVGRVGALAVALGVGAAVASTPGTAWATPDKGSTETVGEKPTSNPDPTGTPSPKVKASPAASPDPTPPKVPAPGPKSDTTVTVGGTSSSSTVSASGGAGTTVGGQTTPPVEEELAEEPAKPAKPKAETKQGSTHQQATSSAGAIADPISTAVTTFTRTTQSTLQRITGPTTASTPSPTTNATARVAALAAPTQTATNTTTLAPEPAPSTPATAVVSAVKMVADAFTSLLAPSPNSPGAPALMWAVLAFARREIERATAPPTAATAPVATLTTSQTLSEEEAGARMALMSAADAGPAAALPPGGSVDLANAGGTATGNPAGVVLNANGSRAYVTNKTTNTITVIDTATGNPIGSPISLPGAIQPTDIVMTADGSRLFVANRGSNNVSVINTSTATPTFIKNVNVGTNPEHLAISPDGTRLWISNAGSNTLTKISTTGTNAITTPSINVGAAPGGIAFSPNGDYAYVANQNSGTVSVINTSNNTVKLLTGTVGANPTDIVVNNDTNTGYITTLSGKVTTFNTATNTVTGAITTGKNATAATLSPDRKILITANTDDTITAIDTGNGAILDTLQTDPNPEPGTPAITYHPNGTAIYVTDAQDNAIRKASVTIVIAPNTAPELVEILKDPADPATGTVMGSIVGFDADGDTLTYNLTNPPGSGTTITVDPDTGDFSYTPSTVQRLAAANTPNPTATFNVTLSDGRDSIDVPVSVPISALELANSTTAGTGSPAGVVLNANGSRAYVTNKTTNTITVIDTATGNPIGSPISLPGAIQPTDIVMTADGSRLFVANRGSNNVSVINTSTATPTFIKNVNVGTNPEHLAISPDGTRLWISNAGSNTLTKISTTGTNAITTPSINVGAAPGGIAFSPNGDYAYVANQNSGTVSVINTSNNTVKLLTGTVGANPTDIVVNNDTNTGYITTLSGKVTTFNTATNTVTGAITTGKNATAATLSPDRKILITANTDDTITAIDTGNGAILDTLQTDPNPEPGTPAITYHPNGTAIYVTDAQDNLVRTVSFQLANRPPVANNNVGTVNEGSSTSINVLANDTDPDGNSTINPASVVVVSGPTNGTTSVNTTTGAITYQSNGAEVTSDSFSYTVKDTNGAISNTATVNITITPVNDAPIALGNTATVAEGGTQIINVLANDTDVDGTINPTTVIATPPTNGSVSVNPTTGAITYTSNGAEVTSDSFTYTVKDNNGAVSNTATVNITITPVNDAPIASPDSFSTNEDTAANRSLPAGTDADLQPLTYAIVTDPTSGSITNFNAATGSYTYTPNAAQQGLDTGETQTDSFTYRVNDGTTNSNTATVTITITGLNDAPVAGSPSFTIDEDAIPSGLMPATDVDGEALTYNLINPPQYGNLTWHPTQGTYIYHPHQLQFLDTGESRTDSFTYTVSDGDATATGTVTFTVMGVNDAPVATNDSFSTDEDTAVNRTLPVGSDIDIEPRTYAIVTAPTHGSISNFNATTGSYTYTPNAAQQALNTGQSQLDSFTYKVNDGTVDSNTATVTITITGVTDGTPGIDAIAIGDNGDGQRNIPALPPGVTYTQIASGLAHTVLLRSDGTAIAVGHNGFGQTNIPAPPPGTTYTQAAAGPFHTVLLRSDGTAIAIGRNSHGQTNIPAPPPGTTYTQAAAGVDHTVLLRSDGTAIAIGSNGNGQTNIPAPPPGTTYTQAAAGYFHTVLLRSDGTAVAIGRNGDGQTNIPAPPPGTTYTQAAAGSSHTVLLRSDGTAIAIGNNFSGQTNIPALPPGTTYTQAAAGGFHTVLLRSDGTAIAFGNNNFGTATIPALPPGVHYTQVSAGDVHTVLLTDAVVNFAPTAVNDSFSTNEDTAANRTLPTGNDVDGDTRTYAIVAHPTKGTITNFNAATGSYTYTPNAAQQSLDDGETASDSFTYKANDGTTDSNTATITITITGVNDAPTAANDAFTTNEDTAANRTLPTGSDVDVETLTYAIVAGPTFGTISNFNAATGAYTYTPNAAQQALDTGETAPDSFTYKVNDGTIDSTPATVTITITGLNDAPTAASYGFGIGEDGAAVVTPPAGSDVDGETLTYALVAGPTFGSISNFNAATGSYTYTPNAAQQGLDTSETQTDSLTYRVNDGTVDSEIVTVNISVFGANDAPVAASDSFTTNEDTAVNRTLPAGTDVDVESLTYAIVANPTRGSISNFNTATGSYTYTPNAAQQGLDTGETAPDSFTYKVNDGTTDSTPATVTITITGVNDAPIATPDSFGAFEDAAVNRTLPTGSDVDVETLTYAILANPIHGTITNLNPATGTYTYTPNTAQQALDSGETQADSFTYRVNDDTTDSNTATVSITIGGLNDTPVAAPDSFSTNEDTAVNRTLPAGSDVDVETLAYAIVSSPTHGTITNFNAATGTYTYNPKPSQQSLDTGETQADSFTYKVNDFTTDSNTATVTVTITGANDAPTAAADSFTTNEDTAVNRTLPAGTDVDVEALTYSIVTNPTRGDITNFNAATGTYTYTPNAAQQALNTGQSQADSFTYRVSDGIANSNTATVSITITGITDATPGVDAVAFGYNGDGQTNLPALPAGVTWTQVDGGAAHTVLVRSDGTAVAVGWNDYGQTNIPALPAGLTYTQATAGGYHTVLLRSNGTVVAVGQNIFGQTTIPTLPAGVTYTQVAAGDTHTVLLRSDGTAVAFGNDSDGRINIPVLPAGVTYTQAAAGAQHTVLLRSDGNVVIVGSNEFGQRNIPVLPAGVTYTQVAAGAGHTVLLRSNGTVVAFGYNSVGQTNIPVLPAGVTYTQVAAGDLHTVFLRSNGTVVAVGNNSSGESTIPALPPGAHYTQVAAGDSHTILLTDTVV